MLIYQQDEGRDNTAKVPLGGIIFQSSVASSMATTIANPITFYYGSGAVINQAGHSGDLYNYYWTSYSRGTDGRLNNSTNEPQWHNAYLDGYIPLRAKSIYDPCPYLYRIPSNGTWNQFSMQTGWTTNSYIGGASWNLNALGESWFVTGRRNPSLSIFEALGCWGYYYSSMTANQTTGYAILFNSGKGVWPNRDTQLCSIGNSVRCIEAQ